MENQVTPKQKNYWPIIVVMIFVLLTIVSLFYFMQRKSISKPATPKTTSSAPPLQNSQAINSTNLDYVYNLLTASQESVFETATINLSYRGRVTDISFDANDSQNDGLPLQVELQLVSEFPQSTKLDLTTEEMENTRVYTRGNELTETGIQNIQNGMTVNIIRTYQILNTEPQVLTVIFIEQ